MGISAAERRYRRALARNLRRLRADQRVTQDALGRASDLHGRHVQKLEAGEVNVSLRTLSRLAEGLCVEVVELLQLERSRARGL